MANIMSMKSIKNNVSRNGFDLSFKNNFTAKAGELLPIMHRLVLPPDKFTIDLKTLTRTMPLNTAAFARIRQHFDFYFVPMEQLWNKFPTLVTQMYDNNYHANGISPDANPRLIGKLPHVTCYGLSAYLENMQAISKSTVSSSAAVSKNYFGYSRAALSCKLFDYLNFGNYYDMLADTPVEKYQFNVAQSIMPFLAYQKIYSDFFRDTQWEKAQPWTFNVDYLTGDNEMTVYWDNYLTNPSFDPDSPSSF